MQTVDAAASRASPAAGLRSLFGRAATGVMSQGVNAGTNFLITLLLARTMAVEEFGVFAFIYAIVFLLQSPVIGIVCEPMLIFARVKHGHEIGRYLWISLQLALCISLFIDGMVFAAWVALPYEWPVIATAIAFPAVCLYTTGRIACFARDRQGYALEMDLVYAGVSVAGLAALHYTTEMSGGSALAVIGVASLCALAFVMRRDSDYRAVASSGSSLRSVVRENWRFGHSLIWYNALRWAATLGIVPFAGALVGTGAAAGFRVEQTLFQPFNQVSVALLMTLIPVASQRQADGGRSALKRFVFGIGAALVAAALIYYGALEVLARPLMRLLFRPEYQAYAFLFPYFGAATVIQSIAASLTISYRAQQRTPTMLLAEASGGVTSAVAGCVFAWFWGLHGLGASMVLAAVTGLGVLAAHQKKS